MKTLLTAVAATVLLLSLSSCKKDETSTDPCDGTCPPNSTCNGNTCDCNNGFSGSNCETQNNLAFAGTYVVRDSGTYRIQDGASLRVWHFDTTYTTTIGPQAGGDEITINNFLSEPQNDITAYARDNDQHFKVYGAPWIHYGTNDQFYESIGFGLFTIAGTRIGNEIVMQKDTVTSYGNQTKTIRFRSVYTKQ